MLEKGKITVSEFYILIITYSIGTSILVVPGTLIHLAKQDAWISSLLALVESMVLIYMYNKLCSLNPAMTFVEMNEKILGKWLGKITAILYISYFFVLAYTLLMEIGNFFTSEILVETPVEIIMVIFLLTSLVGVRLGLEVICRTVVIFFPWIILLLIMLFLFLIPEMKTEHIMPWLADGIKPILLGSYHNLGHPYLELILFLMITPYVSETRKIKKAFYIGMLIGGVILILFVLFSIFVLGPDITARQTYPSYMLGRKIGIGTFLQRIEIMVAIIWILSIYFKLTLCYYGISLGLAQILGLKNYQFLLFPLAGIIFPFAILAYPNIAIFNQLATVTWTSFSISVCFFLPLLLLIIEKIKMKISDSKVPKA